MNYKIEYQDLSFSAYLQIKAMILRKYTLPYIPPWIDQASIRNSSGTFWNN
jgi:hypothetical protein